ncbi:MAG: SpoVA/SpoVAEb family sporulation membrane protein [Bacilli bacterium]|nr:SpoVA/SpoVAEb family sporulation membrane protein [Bacilli bacterium]MDD7315077.1 SpoVA/SpoVAEb family sporulation membrane protein [Bacilli bacterium]MDY4052720.1 SpoVA/SpoVAEb family sporulation membrane protein [Bacilli bacterium]
MNRENLNTYKNVIEKNPVKRPILKNAIYAFLIGGLIGGIAEGLIDFFTFVVGLEEKVSNSMMSMTIVFITSILTGIGIFDKIGQVAGAGTFIPITGFANSMTSSSLEGKSEGLVLGIMSNIFKLAGAVIVAGVVSAFISGTAIYIIRELI